MCCFGKMCRLCTCLILLVILIGLLFGFGVFKHGFHKLSETLHECSGGNETSCSYHGGGRPFLGYGAPNPM
ncbi:uncharacterized protein LOC131257333 [Magnolia sinica]|uniref:uncharacterized protein LOC131257333 n=1 Tax=Magnolia sinica TaxID=86752 RepID=UPI002657D155|nr:uncharacterized protein LOC131257333 [Magnolia sinica]